MGKKRATGIIELGVQKHITVRLSKVSSVICKRDLVQTYYGEAYNVLAQLLLASIT